ncbi:hypothetical protein [Wenjunlia tyrosinilytica]|uniref:Uncharacterized protein n=1 Tax=Wenjunlia tyrosinilytica TaxID=1544741 RepID=A0A918E0C5_9ACTN|nr:hypothetical protein [Wenjunlia tyrosinilytica]GGO98117.1 hypothetical protein GCM10012280_61500 [Wenjunlia tyrosinilytica]
MSVTFSALVAPIAFVNVCADGEERIPVRHETYPQARAALPAHTQTCGQEDCAVYGVYPHPVYPEGTPEEVNVSNANARYLLGLLGLDTEDLCGTLPGADLARLVLRALNRGFDDTGMGASAPLREAGRAQFIDCGRPAGYGRARLEELQQLALWASTNDKEITWG